MKTSGIGGQAVLEGIMMKNKEKYAVAVRKPDNEIEVCVKEYKGITNGKKILSLPFIRGVFNFVDSMILGISTLTYSASFYDDEEDKDKENTNKKDTNIKDTNIKDTNIKDTNNKDNDNKDKNEKVNKNNNTENIIMGVTVFISILLALGLFIVLPSIISDFIKKQFNIISYTVVSLIEGAIRIILFISYLFIISKMKDIQRTFMYHGAEHKCINCIESGMELNVENVMKSSRFHKRCGTSFLFLVMAISIIFFILVPVSDPVMKIIVRLLLIPVIAGVSYEVLKLAGRSENRLVKIISAPGIALQRLTTREPDEDMVEVAIKSVEAVFDWREFLEKYEV